MKRQDDHWTLALQTVLHRNKQLDAHDRALFTPGALDEEVAERARQFRDWTATISEEMEQRLL